MREQLRRTSRPTEWHHGVHLLLSLWVQSTKVQFLVNAGICKGCAFTAFPLSFHLKLWCTCAVSAIEAGGTQLAGFPSESAVARAGSSTEDTVIAVPVFATRGFQTTWTHCNRQENRVKTQKLLPPNILANETKTPEQKSVGELCKDKDGS